MMPRTKKRRALPIFILLGSLFSWACALAFAASEKTPLAYYPLPTGYSVSDQIKMSVNGVELPVIAHTAIYDYSHFSCDGPITIKLTASEAITSWHISPHAYNIPATVSGNTLTFTIAKPAYLIVKINSLRHVAIAADPVETDVPPSTGPGIYNIVSAPYKADSSGTKHATTAVQKAIDDAHAASGGIVYVPPGVYTCASLILRSHVSLYLAGGAVLKSSGKPADFKTYYHKHSIHMDGTWFIYTEPDSTNIKIYGRGTIDGNGRILRGEKKYLNNLVVPLQTSHFTIDGVLLNDSGLWGLIITRSDNVVIRNTKHFNENDKFHENDSIDIIESQNVLVSRTIAIAEDDNYSTKTWEEGTDIAKHWPGSPEMLVNSVFEDCVGWSRCATYKMGFGNFQTQRNIVFKDSFSYQSMRAVALNRFWGTAPTENVTFDNIDVEDFWPRDGNPSKWLDVNTGSNAPVINTVIKNINVRNVGNVPSRIEGFSTEAKIDGLLFENITIKGTPARSLGDINAGKTNSYIAGLRFETPSVIKAARHSEASSANVKNEPCLDADGGDSITGANDGNWIKLDAVNFGTGKARVHLRTASAVTDSSLELRLDSPDGRIIAAIPVEQTVSWQAWRTQIVDLNGPTGTHPLYIIFKAGKSGRTANVNWLRFDNE